MNFKLNHTSSPVPHPIYTIDCNVFTFGGVIYCPQTLATTRKSASQFVSYFLGDNLALYCHEYWNLICTTTKVLKINMPQ